MNDIKNAFSELEPDKETADRLYNKILSSSYAPAFKSKKKKIWLTKKNATIIACAGILVAGTIVSTCSALVLNVNKKHISKQETTTESTYEERKESSETSESTEKNAMSSENEKIENNEEQTEAQTEIKIPLETEVSKKTEKVTVNGRDYIVVTSEHETKKDNKLHASDKDIIPAVTEKTEKSTEKTTKKSTQKSTEKSTEKATKKTIEKTTVKTTQKIVEKTTIKTTSEPSKSDIVTSQPEKVDIIVTTKTTEIKTEVPKTSDVTKIETVPAETTAVYGTTVNCTNEEVVHTTVIVTTKVENTAATAGTENTSTETTIVVSPWNYTIVTYNGQNYYFDGNQTTYENTQHYLGPYRIYNQNLRDYIIKDTYFIDDDNVAVEINSVLYIYSR